MANGQQGSLSSPRKTGVYLLYLTVLIEQAGESWKSLGAWGRSAGLCPQLQCHYSVGHTAPELIPMTA